MNMYPSGKDRPTFDDVVHFVRAELPTANLYHDSAKWDAMVAVGGVTRAAYDAALPAIRDKLPPYVHFTWIGAVPNESEEKTR